MALAVRAHDITKATRELWQTPRLDRCSARLDQIAASLGELERYLDVRQLPFDRVHLQGVLTGLEHPWLQWLCVSEAVRWWDYAATALTDPLLAFRTALLVSHAEVSHVSARLGVRAGADSANFRNSTEEGWWLQDLPSLIEDCGPGARYIREYLACCAFLSFRQDHPEILDVALLAGPKPPHEALVLCKLLGCEVLTTAEVGFRWRRRAGSVSPGAVSHHVGSSQRLAVAPTGNQPESVQNPSAGPRSKVTLTDIRARVAAQLERGGAPDLNQVAHLMGLSSRTLQRILATAGTTFMELLDAARFCRAKELLAEHAFRVEDVGRRLGFADAVAFRRAFRRWTGTTPAAFRAANRTSQDQEERKPAG